MTPVTASVRAAAILAAMLFLSGCNGGAGDPDVEPLAAPTAEQSLESLDDLPGGIGPSDETPDAPPSPL
ncbi:hypothetical protein [Microbaculum sp. FT89]|uniref:hypothetical protein n=1 Tax=Microbaculum sp. FT89 TaxID=3447298 RepID=UPI003F52AAEC